MGVLSGKDLFSSKYLTAEIINSENRAFFVPIQNTIGDYFIADIDGQFYVFKITDKIKTYRTKFTRSFRYITYHTSHFMPMSPADVKGLEDVLTKNSLPKVNMRLFKLFKLLGEREKQKFEPHDMQKIINEIIAIQEEEPEAARNMVNFLKGLEIEQIVTPVKKVADYIQEDLLPTNPAFLGNVIAAWLRADTVKKKVTNSPTTGKKPWLKVILIISLIGLVIGIAYWAWSSGVFSNIIPSFGGSDQLDTQQILEQYPTPEALKAAIDRGDVDYNKLPPDVKKLVDTAVLPTLEQNP